jgi:hypothetical protein
VPGGSGGAGERQQRKQVAGVAGRREKHAHGGETAPPRRAFPDRG